MNLVSYLFAEAEKHRGKNNTAICTLDRSMTYEELLSSVRRCTGLFRGAGIEAGERVALLASDSPEWIAAFLGAVGADAIAVPLGTMLQERDLISILEDSKPRSIVVSEDLFARWRRIAPQVAGIEKTFVIGEAVSPAISFQEALSTAEECEPVEARAVTAKFARAEKEQAEACATSGIDRAPAFILYTSGSTGRPKGAVHAHGDVRFTVECFSRDVLRVSNEDRVYSSSKLYFAYGLGNSLSFPLASGATSLLLDARPRPELIARVFSELRPTIYFGVPATFRGLLDFMRAGGALDCSSLRVCVSAGEALPAALFHEWETATGMSIIDAIGSTEMLHMFLSNRPDRIVPGSSGFPLRNYEARLVNHEGAIVDGAGSGDLFVRGGSCMLGYWNNDEKTRETIAGGWVKTGDVYRRDEEGAYFFEGRSDDLFKVNGLWVSPLEIESALLSHPDVREVAVIAAHDPDRLTEAVAYVVSREGAANDAEALRDHVREQLPGYKCPSAIRFVEELPRTPTGKVQRFKLRERETLARSPGQKSSLH